MQTELARPTCPSVSVESKDMKGARSIRTGQPDQQPLDPFIVTSVLKSHRLKLSSQPQVSGRGDVLSSDTSRSPIPIDEETYKNMNRHLPKRMDAQSNDQCENSRSRDRSLEHE